MWLYPGIQTDGILKQHFDYRLLKSTSSENVFGRLILEKVTCYNQVKIWNQNICKPLSPGANSAMLVFYIWDAIKDH